MDDGLRCALLCYGVQRALRSVRRPVLDSAALILMVYALRLASVGWGGDVGNCSTPELQISLSAKRGP